MTSHGMALSTVAEPTPRAATREHVANDGRATAASAPGDPLSPYDHSGGE